MSRLKINETKLLSTLLIFLIALTLINTVQFFKRIQTPPTPLLYSDKNINQIPEQHLFGHAAENIAEDIPLSTLNLQLTGVFFLSPHSAQNEVSITADNKDEKIYHEGDTLPGGALIKIINTENIILEYNGHVEKLLLYSPHPTESEVAPPELSEPSLPDFETLKQAATGEF